jgi:histidinol phosphatase-like enzyme (inositol monophosphatase family)
MRTLQQYLDFAVDAAWQAGRRVLAHYQTGVSIERKPDRSAVTIADREGEKLIRRLIEARFPDHAIVGEELGGDTRDASHRWIVDPIDGTNSFVRGVPLFGVMIALEIGSEQVVGVTYFPALDEMIAAAHGLGCRWNGRLAAVSSVTSVADACVAFTEARHLTARLGPDWAGLLRDSALERGWGDCYGHCLVATGRADIMLDPRMNPWDCAALIPIVQEAGGRFTAWDGHVTIDGGDAVSTNGALHDEVITRLAAHA